MNKVLNGDCNVHFVSIVGLERRAASAGIVWILFYIDATLNSILFDIICESGEKPFAGIC